MLYEALVKSRVRICLSNTCGMNIDVHVTYTIFFVFVFKAAEDVIRLFVFKIIGLQKFHDVFIAGWDSFERLKEWFCYGIFLHIVGLFLNS